MGKTGANRAIRGSFGVKHSPVRRSTPAAVCGALALQPSGPGPNMLDSAD